MNKLLGITAVLVTVIAGQAHATSVTSQPSDDGAALSAKAGAASKVTKGKQGRKHKKPARPSVKILQATQNSLTGSGIKLRVKANRRMKVRVTVRTTSFDEGTWMATKARTMKFGKRGKRVVTIPLTTRARSAASLCSARTLTATAQTGKRKRTSSATMLRQAADCQLAPVDLARAGSCDFIAQPKEGLCMLPFPNDYYTREDGSSPTGKRIAFTAGGMPKNSSGIPVDPSPYLASDGFSQGQGILLKVPGIDDAQAVAQNNFVTIDQLSRYTEANQKAVVIDTKTGKRWPIWVEIDANATTPQGAALMISPAVNFDEKGRYVVALRNLTDKNGTPLKAPDAFRYYRDALPSGQAPVENRRSHFESIFQTLKDAGIKRSELYLAWDFTVASDENNYRRVLHMRNEAFKAIGDSTMADNVAQGSAPAFTVTDQPNDLVGPVIGRRIVGTYTVPCFMTEGCEPGAVFDLDQNGLPKRHGNYEANFECLIPTAGLEGPEPPRLRPFVYGHGLFGGAGELPYSIAPDLSQDHGMMGCATDEIGMSGQDLGGVAGALTDLSGFPIVPDRLQQGLINELFLARLMYHPNGLGSSPAFQDGNGIDPGDSVIRTDHVYYAGASQGGIMGGPLTAISPDFTQSGLVVGGMNYSTLLTRSSNWSTYGTIYNAAYANQLSRPLVLNLVQMLWDRGEANGFAHRMTDNPPPETPKHNITLITAVGDHQVSNFTSDVWARTAGFDTNRGGIDPLRWPNYESLWDVRRIPANEYPYRGSSIVYWDGGPYRRNPDDLSETIGTGTPPLANVAPNSAWEDPHGAPRGAEGPIAMLGSFLQPNGYINDICGSKACVGSGWDGDFSSVIAP